MPHHEQGWLEDARAMFEAALAIDERLAGGWANLGAVLFELGLTEHARQCLERSLSLSDDPDVRDNLDVILSAHRPPDCHPEVGDPSRASGRFAQTRSGGSCPQ